MSSSPKICYIVSDINKAVFFEKTALELRKSGYECSFVLINCTGGAFEAFVRQNEFNVFTLEANSLWKSFGPILKVRSWLKKHKIQTVHCHLAHANWIGLWGSFLANTKNRIFTRHSGEPLDITWKEKLIDRIQNTLATKVVAISKVIDDLLCKQGVSDKKRVLIHHGFDLESFELRNEEKLNKLLEKYNPQRSFPVVGVNARWMEWKGVQYIIPAFQRVMKEYPGAKLILFGGSPTADFYTEINKLLSEIPQENKQCVEFESDVFSLYHMLDVYVHVPVNATCEAFGQTYVEALAAGVPSVFTLSGIAQEFVVDGWNACVVPFRSSEKIASSILRILADQDLKSSLIENGKKSVVLFTFDRYVQEIVQLYNVRK